ncbi:MAG: NTP transferase domain-containing protein [Blastocatellia bacterium]
MKRVLIIPAAGLGSRLQSEIPKVLFPVMGRAMIDYLFDLYAPFVDLFVLVLHPQHSAMVESHCKSMNFRVDFALQPSPTGMLDAILIPQGLVQRHLNDDDDQVWITWCDQIAVHRKTVEQLAIAAGKSDGVVMPTVARHQPYIHWARNEQGEIVELHQRREGDEMPEVGEGDMGLFSLSRLTYLDLLPRFAAKAGFGHKTSERNFLPFIPWLAGKVAVETFPVHNEIESIGINTRTELALVENYLNGKTKTIGNHSSL